MPIILSTRNPSKAHQIKEIFTESPFTILTLAEAGVEGEAIEDGATLEENALKKARFAREQADNAMWTMADDTGIFINALGGEPGIRSARWAGETATTADITNYCLARLKGCADRTASFRTVVALIDPSGTEKLFVGEVEGTLLETPRVPPQPKMPYSPLFVPQGEVMCWAEMPIEYENKISHRGKAFRLARTFLESTL